MENNKWRNYGMWISIVAAVLLIVQASGDIFGFTLTEELNAKIMALAVAVLGLLVLLGIISNPKEGKGYKDDNTKVQNSKTRLH